MSNKVAYATDTVTAFLIQPLTQDLGNSLLDSYFDKYKSDLVKELVPFLRFLQNNEQILSSIDDDTFEFRKNLLLFLCEQTAPKTPYQISELPLLASIENLLHENFEVFLENDSKLELEIFDYYCLNLKAETWKKNLGAAHGFEQFLLYRFLDRSKLMDAKWSRLALSVGLLFNEFFDTDYKEMSYRLFSLVLDKSVKSVITEGNIHTVIYSVAIKDIDTFDTESGNELLLSCLYKYFNYATDNTILSWNKIDDLMEAILRKISMASSCSVVTVLISFIFKIFSRVEMGESPTKLILAYSTDSVNFKNNIGVIREIVQSCRTTSIYRWTKNILELFVSQGNYLMGAPRDCETLILNMHLCYLVAVYPIPLYAIEPHLFTFHDKFPSILMEVLTKNKEDFRIKTSVKMFVETISKHLSRGEMILSCPAFDEILLYLER